MNSTKQINMVEHANEYHHVTVMPGIYIYIGLMYELRFQKQQAFPLYHKKFINDYLLVCFVKKKKKKLAISIDCLTRFAKLLCEPVMLWFWLWFYVL